jgi:hypothetical protein
MEPHLEIFLFSLFHSSTRLILQMKKLKLRNFLTIFYFNNYAATNDERSTSLKISGSFSLTHARLANSDPP